MIRTGAGAKTMAAIKVTGFHSEDFAVLLFLVWEQVRATSSVIE